MEFKLRAIKGELSLGPSCGINLFAYQSDGNTGYSATKLELVQKPRGEEVQPFLRIENHEAQKLMDDLWDCGIRPSEGTGSAGSLKATQRHLEDMKTVAFHVLKISKGMKNG